MGGRRGAIRRRPEGWAGWDTYAPFYDWENRRTVGRRDVPFWRSLAMRIGGRALELGCGTGRILLPVARAGANVVGVDRSSAMLERAVHRLRRARVRCPLVRADIRFLPFAPASFDLIMAPYGMLQSLLSDADVRATLSEAARVARPGAWIGIDLVPDVPHWAEYDRRVTLRGRAAGGVRLTLIESVRQDRGRGLTIFDHEYVRRRRTGTEDVSRFSITFRTMSIDRIVDFVAAAGFEVQSVLGDYRGRPWDERGPTWLVIARRGEASP